MLRSLLFPLVFAGALAQFIASAQAFLPDMIPDGPVVNDPDPFAEHEACAAYLAFLDERPAPLDQTCFEAERLIVAYGSLRPGQFLRTSIDSTAPGTVHRMLLMTAFFALNGDMSKTYEMAEHADRALSIAMVNAGDVERASLYAALMSRLKRDAIEAGCERSEECLTFSRNIPIRQIVGNEFEALEELKTAQLFLCLLRSDAFTVRIRQVLRSAPFRTCAGLD